MARESGFVHAVQKKGFERALRAVGKKAKKSRGDGYVGVVNAIEKVLGDGWSPEAYNHLREALAKDGKWTSFFGNLLDTTDPDYLRGLVMAFGFEAGFSGYKTTQRISKREDVSIPWVILFDPTSACNLKCKGCWSAEYAHHLNMSFEDMDDLVTQGKQLGIHAYVMTGGEPLVRKKDIVRLAEKHGDCGFLIFTNATLVDQTFCDDMKRCKNIVLSLSIEGMEESTDARRGSGVFKAVVHAMDLLRQNGVIFGTSICYTRANCEAVTSDAFLDFLIEKGVKFSWYFHYMPVGNDASVELIPTIRQREYMYHRIREIRAYEGGKPIFTIDFQNDGEFVSGCVAGGKYYCHINPNGDVEPCVFIHYSSANIHQMTLLDCLKQPLFREYQKAQPFNRNLLMPCPMLENPEFLMDMVERSGAKSTDMMSPEDVHHLCAKCDHYAAEWAPKAEELWRADHKEEIQPVSIDDMAERESARIAV